MTRLDARDADVDYFKAMREEVDWHREKKYIISGSIFIAIAFFAILTVIIGFTFTFARVDCDGGRNYPHYNCHLTAKHNK